MRFENFTKLDSEWLREVIRFCCPPGVSGFDIAFKNCARGYRGRAYIEGCDYHIRPDRRGGRYRGHYAPPYIVIGCSIRRADHKWTSPYRFSANGAYMGITVYSEAEAVVHVIAHELRHMWQKKVKSGRRVWGARGQYSERDADAYGLRMLRAWRRR